MASCFYCGKRKTKRSTFYKLDKDGHEICQSCMREGFTKSALEIIEHNNNVDRIKQECGAKMDVAKNATTTGRRTT